ncbi:MAG: OmpA family protein [Paludibacter sp.]
MKKIPVVLLFILLIQIPLFGQSKYLKLIDKDNFPKAEKRIIKELSKKPNDIELNFAMALLLKERKCSIYNPDSSYIYLLKSKYLFETMSDDKELKKLEKVPINQTVFLEYIDSICGVALEDALAVNSINSYQKFLGFFKTAPNYQIEKAVEKRDILAYKLAADNNTVESFQNFITTYPKATQINIALRKRNGLAFKKEKAIDNIDSYLDFIKHYPSAEEIPEAKERLHELAFIDAKKSNSSVAYKVFTDTYPDSKQVNNAHKLYDEKQFEELTSGFKTWEEYAGFVESYPNNSFKSVAIDSIQSYIVKTQDIEAANYCVANFADSDKKRAILIYHDVFTNDGEKQTLDLFYDKYDDENLSEIKTKDYELAELGDNLMLNMPYDSLNFSTYDSFIKLAAPHERAFVALQKMISHDISKKHWKKATEKLKLYAPLFASNNKKINSLIATLENSWDNSINILSVGIGINTIAGGEYAPAISADDKLLYFCGRNRKDNIGGEDIFVSKKQKGAWSIAKLVSSLSMSLTNDAPECISADGTTMILFQSGKLNYAQKTTKGWSESVEFPEQINGGKWQADAILSSDGKAIVFASTKSGGFNLNNEPTIPFHGGSNYATDIYVSTLNESNEWSEPINLGKVINTPYCDRSPFLHPDMKTLYFSSDGHGGLGNLDVYKSTRLADSCWNCWSEPINMGKEINTTSSDWGYKISTNGEMAYFSKTNSAGSSEDIYSLNLPKYLRPGLVATVTGKLIDKDNQPVTAEIRWEDLETGKNVGKSKSDPTDGSFFIVLPIGKIYGYFVDEDKYFPISNHVDLRENKKPVEIEENINMVTFKQMVEEGTAVQVNNLFFNFSESALLPYSLPELKRVATIIKANQLKVEISGHTDNIGDDQKNQILSEQRALAVKEFLVKEGCNADNFITKGYGKTRPVATNENDSGRAKNRRVELKFVK